MAGQIRITPDQMRSRATEYRGERDKVQDVISRMDSLLSALQGEWEGESSRAYASRFLKAHDLIDEIAQSLDATAQTLEETDSNIAGSFRG